MKTTLVLSLDEDVLRFLNELEQGQAFDPNEFFNHLAREAMLRRGIHPGSRQDLSDDQTLKILEEHLDQTIPPAG